MCIKSVSFPQSLACADLSYHYMRAGQQAPMCKLAFCNMTVSGISCCLYRNRQGSAAHCSACRFALPLSTALLS